MPRPTRLSRRNARASGIYEARARLGGIARAKQTSAERLRVIGLMGVAARLAKRRESVVK